MRKLFLWALGIFLLCNQVIFAAPAIAIVWKETRIPMKEAGSAGLEALLVWPNDSHSHPMVLLSHGSPRDQSERAKMSAISYLPIAKEFARRGFSVAVVLRRGYGTSGGTWDTYGKCESPNYLQAALTSTKDLQAAINYLAKLPQFDAKKILAVGVSAGGFATVALTADNPPPGLIGAISFAGGRGSTADNQVCGADQLVQAFGELGKTSRVPMLWVYAENDHFFNPALAKRFHDAFEKSGGDAQFVIAPAYESEGHFLFSNGGISTWTPYLDNFLKSQDLVLVSEPLPLPTVNLMPPSGLSESGRQDFVKYVNGGPHKAFAVSRDGAYGWRTGQRTVNEAKSEALDFCRQHADKECEIYAVDDQIKRKH